MSAQPRDPVASKGVKELEELAGKGKYLLENDPSYTHRCPRCCYIILKHLKQDWRRWKDFVYSLCLLLSF